MAVEGRNKSEPRAAVVGYGARAAIAANVPVSYPGASVTAIVEPSENARERARTDYPDAALFPDIQALIAADVADVAIVTTPDDTHEQIAVALLDAGIAVYLEKPLATTLEGADRILATAAETGTPLYVGHNFRHSGVVRGMRRVIERGEIGEVKAVWVRHFVGNGPDYYFKDWHAERAHTNTLLLQKASHDIDIVHYLAGGYTRRVVGMGGLTLLGGITARGTHPGQTMPDWFSFDNWPPLSNTGLNPVVDVEDLSMMLMGLDNGVYASYEQCHYTPDYWRNYTVIGTEGRLENFGDTAGGVIRVWNTRREWQLTGDREYPIEGVQSGHEDADEATMREFFAHVFDGAPTVVSPIAAREAVAAGALAADSLRHGSEPRTIPEPDPRVLSHFSS